MKKFFIFLASLAFVFPISAQNFWKKKVLNNKSQQLTDNIQHLYNLNYNEFKEQVEKAPLRNSGNNPIVVYIPTMDGKTERFMVFKTPILDESLEQKYKLSSYTGIGLDNNQKYIKFSISSKKFNSVTINEKGDLEFIDPTSKDISTYSIKERKNYGAKNFTCYTPEILTTDKQINTNNFQTFSNTQKLRTFRLALSTTGEYTQLFGGVAGALEQINITMTRVNAILEKDVSINLKVINNTEIIFTDPKTDPYSNSNGLKYWNSELQKTLTSIIGEENYDIGHLFGASGGGGNAGCIGCVCIDGEKGSGITSPSIANQPFGDEFDVDFVVHEIGHQLGANHTFSYRLEGVLYSDHPYGLANREPGSGSTIMGYAGITGTSDVQKHSNDYFHQFSIFQISKNLQSKNCGTETLITNKPPVAKVNKNSIIIPIGTRFYLDAKDSFDPDGDPVTFCWEQNDIPSKVVTTIDPKQEDGPIFRSFLPTTSSKRFFPSLKNKTHDISNWETVSDVPRKLNFRVTLRDNSINGPQTSFADQEVIVSDAGGPFVITAPTALEFFEKGKEIKVSWKVANTDRPPFNVQNVKIWLLTDREDMITLIERTANNGSALVKLPNDLDSKNSKIIVEAIENPFLAMSESFSIGYKVIETCKDYRYKGMPIIIPDRNRYSDPEPAIVNVDVPYSGIKGDITSIKAYIDIDHEDISDLMIDLKTPNNKKVTLWQTDCYSSAERFTKITATFDDNGETVKCGNPTLGNIKPKNPLKSLINKNYNGNWSLLVYDYFFKSKGQINDFYLNICSIDYANINEGNKSDIIIRPNPSSGKYFGSLTNVTTNEPINVKIYNNTGEIISTFEEKTKEFEIDLSNYPSGVYILNLETAGKKLSKKLIKL